MKTSEVIKTYKLLQTARLDKMQSTDKIALIKIVKVFKPIAVAHDDFLVDASERLKHDEFDAEVAAFNKARNEGQDTLTDAEVEYLKSFLAYDREVSQCIAEDLNKDNELDYNRLTAEGFEDLLESNPSWSVDDIITLEANLI